MLPKFDKDLQEPEKSLEVTPATLLKWQRGAPPAPPAGQPILAGLQKYEHIPVPILADLCASGRATPNARIDSAARAAMEARDEATTGAQVAALEAGIPSAQVVRLQHANHYVFRSNEPDAK